MKITALLASFLALTGAFAATPKSASKTVHPEGSKHLGGLLRFGEDVEIRSGDTVDGPIFVVGGSVSIAGSVDGPIFVLGGSAIVSGKVDGPIVTFGGPTDLKSGAEVDGPAVAIGGRSIVEDGARIEGEVLELPWSPQGTRKTLGLLIAALAGLLGSFFITYKIFTTAGWIALALVVWLLFGSHLENSRASLQRRPGLTALVGILFWPSLGVVCLTLLISILGIPFLPVVALIVACAWFWGFSTIAYYVGGRLGGDRWQNQAYSVLAGALLLQLLRWLPGARWIVTFAVAIFGIGTAILSGFGSRPLRSLSK